LNETRIQKFCTYQEIHKAILNNKSNILSCYDQHGTTILYDKMISLSNTISIRHSNAKFIVTTFSKNKWKAIHVIAIYNPPEMQIPYFLSILKTIIQKLPMDCQPIIIGDFNKYILTNILQSTEL